MTVRKIAEMTWTEVADLDPSRLVAILPIGAIEAHGPHLPLSTDRLIAKAMTRSGAELLSRRGFEVLVLPALDYTAAPFAAQFPGSISIRPETVKALLEDIARSLAQHGVGVLALANAHLDPTHLGSLHGAKAAIHQHQILRVVFPDVCRKPWALRLTTEFKSGACHAGQYESSIVLSERSDLVREHVRCELPPNPRSLSTAIRQGLSTFEEAGGPEAYFGNPAGASIAEGKATVEVLGEILEQAVVEATGHD